MTHRDPTLRLWRAFGIGPILRARTRASDLRARARDAGDPPARPRDAGDPPARARDAGVTLIEMMVVLVIIAIVAALIVPNVIGRPDEARVTVARTDVRTIAASLEMYRLDNRAYPTTSQGLEGLVARPAEPPVPVNWTAGGYLSQLPLDPWGNPYIYRAPGEGGPYDLISLGSDGQPGGEGVDADIRNTDLP